MKTALLVNMLPSEYRDLLMTNGLGINYADGEDDLSQYEKHRDYVVRVVEIKWKRRFYAR